MKNIDESVLKYVPAKLRKNVVWADKWKCEDCPEARNLNYYCIAFEFPEEENKGETCYNCVGIADIKWYCKEVLKGRRGFDW